MAELACVPARDLVELPTGADPVAVAALGMSAVAAHMALTWRGELAAGEQVLVLGAGGVVGQAAVQLARVAGAPRPPRPPAPCGRPDGWSTWGARRARRARWTPRPCAAGRSGCSATPTTS
ncbi:hypothetical protein [Nonomuraea sp. NPDC049480]|uniref:hypothetical protein n=1 Tax=Nonomuraea sp. NPDC049480 TaxID=3364353 RepID=UPI0037B4A2CB